MESLFKSVYARYLSANGATLRGIVNNLYLSQAPQNSSYPYIVFSLVSNVPEWTFNDTFEEPVLQFSIFDGTGNADELKSADTIVAAYDALKDLYDWITLDFSGTSTDYLSIYMKRILNQLLITDGVWHYVVQYENFIKKL